MRVPFDAASDADIRSAHRIFAVDSGVPGFREPFAGAGFVPPFVGRNDPAFEIIDLEIEIDSRNTDDLNRLRKRVLEIRGGN